MVDVLDDLAIRTGSDVRVAGGVDFDDVLPLIGDIRVDVPDVSGQPRVARVVSIDEVDRSWDRTGLGRVTDFLIGDLRFGEFGGGYFAHVRGAITKVLRGDRYRLPDNGERRGGE